MAFVKTITSELFDHAEQFDRLVLCQIVSTGPFQKLRPVLGDGFQLFLADRLDALIRLGKVDPPQAIQNPHHLFLVDHDAIGLIHNRIDDRMQAGKREAFVFHVDIRHDHPPFQRTGAIEG